MTAKKFFVIRILCTMIIAGVVSSRIVVGDYILPIITVLSFMILLTVLKKRVKEVIEDERDYEIAGKAARYSIFVFSMVAGLATMVLFALRGQNQVFEIVGSVLAYSVCGLMIFYSLIFKYYQKPDKKYFMKVIIIIALFVFFVFGARLFGGEDDWMCKDGKWIKHGNPSSEMPSKECK